MITSRRPAPPRWCWRGTSLRSPLSRLLDMPCKVNDTILKHFLIKIERRTFFFCLQAVNYLTSTHNEQCKTSRNLIKRQRQGPSADGKWLTQLIKHPSVRLNMASLSHHLREGWDPLHISIFPFPFACGTCIAFIMLTPIYSAFFIKVFTLVWCLWLISPIWWALMDANMMQQALKTLSSAL